MNAAVPPNGSCDVVSTCDEAGNHVGYVRGDAVIGVSVAPVAHDVDDSGATTLASASVFAQLVNGATVRLSSVLPASAAYRHMDNVARRLWPGNLPPDDS